MIEAIKNFLFVQLEPYELEKRFRSGRLSQDRTQIIIVMILTMVIIAGFLGLEISSLQTDADYFLSIPSRIVALTVSFVALWIIHRQPSVRMIDRVTFVWGLVIVIHMLYIHLTRPYDYVPLIVWDILVISGIYFVIPLPLQHQISVSILLSMGSGVIWLLNGISLSSLYDRIAVLAAYIVINIYGIFISRQHHQSRRQVFVFLEREITARQELSARTVELEKMQERLRLLAMTDPLTGIGNRRHFMREISIEFERTKRYGRPLSLMIIDLDNLKEINDTNGHKAGDEALKSFAKVCLSELRATDLFARYGGDEFIALLVQTGQEGARETAERLRVAIEGSKVHVDGKTITLTASIGLTATTGDISSVKELIEIADNALYKAKQGGRNQIVAG